MKTLVKVGLGLALVFGLVAGSQAGDEKTLTGNVMCAKCTLKKADATHCQDVLVVKEGDKNVEYYVEKNAVATQFGHKCQGEKSAKVTGTVTTKDGKMWITPTKMEAGS